MPSSHHPAHHWLDLSVLLRKVPPERDVEWKRPTKSIQVFWSFLFPLSGAIGRYEGSISGIATTIKLPGFSPRLFLTQTPSENLVHAIDGAHLAPAILSLQRLSGG